MAGAKGAILTQAMCPQSANTAHEVGHKIRPLWTLRKAPRKSGKLRPCLVCAHELREFMDDPVQGSKFNLWEGNEGQRSHMYVLWKLTR